MTIKIFALSVICACVYMLLSESKPEFSVLIQIAVFAVLVMWAYPYLGRIIDMIYASSAAANVNSDIIKTALKLTGIAVITGFSSDLLEDAGACSSAQRVTLAAKIIMLSIIAPYVTKTIEFVCSLADK